MTTARLVTLDNNILIDLRNNIDPVATYARQLLTFNREGTITVATTLSTMLERQPPGQERSVQELLAWLEEIGIAREHNFKGPQTIAFNVQGVFTWSVGRELALNQCLHSVLFPQIPFYWRDYLDQQCAKRGIIGTRREAIFELDNKKLPYIPHSPQAPQEWPTPAFDTFQQDEQEALAIIFEEIYRKWGNKKNDSLGLYNHLTNAVHTTYPDQSIFVTCDRHFLNKIAAIRRCGFRGEILGPGEAVSFIEKVAVEPGAAEQRK